MLVSIKSVLLSILLTLIGFNTLAFMSLGESAETLPLNGYLFGLEPQLFLSDGGGTNFGAFFDGQLSEASSLRTHINTGKVDFNALVTYKFIPFPDIDRQPAMGYRAGIGYTRTGIENSTFIHLTPLVSKKTEYQGYELIPYAGIMFNYIFPKGENYLSTQMVGGTEFKIEDAPDLKFTAELGFSLNRSISYFSATIAFPFDKQTGFKRGN